MNFLDSTRSGAMLMDCSIGELLMSKGCIASGSYAEQASLDHPLELLDLHCAQIQSGADIIATNTHCCSLPSFISSFSPQRYDEMLASSVAVAREAAAMAGRRALVAFDLGPSGEMLTASRDNKRAAVYDAFERQIEIGASSGADFIFAGAPASFEEARLALLAAKAVCSIPIVVCLDVFDGLLYGGFSPDSAGLCLRRLGASSSGLYVHSKDFDSTALSRLQAQSNLPLTALIDIPVSSDIDFANACSCAAALLNANAEIVAIKSAESARLLPLLHDLTEQHTLQQRSERYSEPLICSPQTALPLSRAASLKPLTLSDDIQEAVGMILHRADEDKPLNISLRKKSASYIHELLRALNEKLIKTPLAFTVSNTAEAEAALNSYCGIAAVFCEGDAYTVPTVAAKYGAELVE